MPANVNEKTGVSYGVIPSNDVSYVMEQITSKGTNLSFEEAKKDFADSFKAFVEDLRKLPKTEYDESAKDELNAFFKLFWFRPERYTEDVDLEKLYSEPDYDSILSLLDNQGMWDGRDGDGDSYKHEWETENGTVKVLTTTLGGAGLIYVVESPWVADVMMCSPCCPNAGDLKKPLENGFTAYCLPPEDMPEDWQGKARLLTSD